MLASISSLMLNVVVVLIAYSVTEVKIAGFLCWNSRCQHCLCDIPQHHIQSFSVIGEFYLSVLSYVRMFSSLSLSLIPPICRTFTAMKKINWRLLSSSSGYQAHLQILSKNVQGANNMFLIRPCCLVALNATVYLKLYMSCLRSWSVLKVCFCSGAQVWITWWISYITIRPDYSKCTGLK